ncbi:MAG: prepilin-type N-terminal cleavage/methylation domain-containing protein [Fusobacteria bacterium]|nr:prepilin-type N-terminal cleavage/methylation domain-containing protein [Fusobacteriota bacterium]
MEQNSIHGKKNSGFTLLELIIVIVIIGILAAIVTPSFKSALVSSKEAALRADLYITRDAIDQYKADRRHYPKKLEDLITAKYLRFIPVDPMTEKADWKTIPSSVTEQNVYDIRSNSDKTGSNGVKYDEW